MDNNFNSESTTYTVAIALGSNLGDRFYNIELALRLLEVPQHVLLTGDNNTTDPSATLAIINTSFMYETVPMYVTDQPLFINCACLAKTNLQPLSLLRLLKEVESIVGRIPSIRNGPRAIDVDLVFYDNINFDSRHPSQRTNLDNLTGELVVPHPRLAEREFVLRPLNDMIPDYVHPVFRKSIRDLLDELEIPPDEAPMQKVMPFPLYPLPDDRPFVHPSVAPIPSTLTHWTFPVTNANRARSRVPTQTHLMATLNVTPDSFSDGSRHNNIQAALEYSLQSVEAGASIVDVGGYSTRPGAASVSVEEEKNRVIPVIQAVRRIERQPVTELPSKDDALKNIPISIDTFQWEVAQAAISAGANCINDVYAFTGPESYMCSGEKRREVDERMAMMKRVARHAAVPVVLMHSRGDAGQNKDYTMYEYAGKDSSVIEGIRIELGEKIDLIVKGAGGIRRWYIIADPGIGFSKTMEGNLEVLRCAAMVIADTSIGKADQKRRNPLAGYPQLIGASRKSFLGVILAQRGRNTTPTDRAWATASVVACAVQQGASVVRVHDTKEMADVVSIADALWN